MKRVGDTPAALLHQAFARCRGGLAVVAVVSGFINLLYLTSPFFMLQVYDRIIPSGSIGSLVALCLLAGLLFVCQGAFEIVRSRMLSRLAALFEVTLDRVLFRRSLLLCGKQAIVSTSDDLDVVRGFLSGRGHRHFSIFHGCPSIWQSVFCFIPSSVSWRWQAC